MLLTLYVFCPKCDDTIATYHYVTSSMVEGIFKLHEGLCPLCKDYPVTISNQDR